jgi:excisionase family DNA binding protein
MNLHASLPQSPRYASKEIYNAETDEYFPAYRDQRQPGRGALHKRPSHRRDFHELDVSKPRQAMFEVRENAFYTVAELSPGFSIAVSGVRSWIRKGRLKATKVGRNYMILGKDVLTFIQAGYQDSIPPKKQPPV